MLTVRIFVIGLAWFACLGFMASLACADGYEVQITSSYDAENVPVSIPVDHEVRATSWGVFDAERKPLGAVQVTSPSLNRTGDASRAEFHFVLPRIRDDEKLELMIAPALAREGRFEFRDHQGKHTDLTFSGRKVLRYMHEAPDTSTPERLGETYKVYHHAFAPDGEVLLTKGPGGRFPHHRGLFFGFNRISYGDNQRADIWHCRNNETQEHVRVLEAVTGNVLGRHRLLIDWYGRDRKVFAQETRELTAYNLGEGSLIEFSSRLVSKAGPVRLDGDPQHAGFQFRATQHVPDETQHLTYYIRPDGVGSPGEFRNWPKNPQHADLPWNAMSIVVHGERYTVCYLDHPNNPKQARFSERNYGRFGSYFEYDLDVDNPLQVRYRIWIQQGEMTPEEVARRSAQFVKPPMAVAWKAE